MAWTAEDLPPLDGRTVVVTGATSGIGRSAARELARAGARVVLAVRDVARGEAAAAETPGDTEVRRLDLADLASVRAFADGWGDEPIDVLLDNAGVMAVPEGRTVDGFETQLGVNHLGHFALTGLLLPRVRDRVVVVASNAHRMGAIRFDDPNWERGRYQRWRAYGQSKLANMLFTFELARRLAAAGSGVRAVVAHPGWARTELQGRTGSRVQHAALQAANRIVGQSADAGAWPLLYAATQDVPSGAYVGPGGPGEWRGHPQLVGRSAAASDPEAAARLWALSERLTGVTYLGRSA